jgi:hypothetical protein
LRDSTSLDGADAYINGLYVPGAAQLYYDDLSYLLQAGDSATWDALPDTARATWIHKQWEWRAAIASVSLPERLHTHFTRLAYAWDYYPRKSLRGAPTLNAVVWDNALRRSELSDRGLIYVRHGPPDQIIHISPVSYDPEREAWGYWRLSNGRGLFEFSRAAPSGSHVADFYLSAPVPCNGDASGSPEAVPVASSSRLKTSHAAEATFVDYGGSLGAFDPTLGRLMMKCMVSSATTIFDEMQEKHKSIKEGLTALRTESAAPPIKDPLHVLIATYAMRGAGSSTDLFAFAAVPAEEVHAAPNSSEYALRLLMSVEDAKTLTAITVDTAIDFTSPTRFTKGQIIRASIASSVKPLDDATVRFTIRNPNDDNQGQIITTAREIPSLAGFAMSDLVIAEPRDGAWRRGSVRISPIPAHTIAAQTPFRLFYEVYAVQEGDPLAVELTIAPGDDKNVLNRIKSLIQQKSAYQVSFADRAAPDAGGIMRQVRELQGDLQPGSYVVSVKLTNGRTQKTVEAHTDLVVVKD